MKFKNYIHITIVLSLISSTILLAPTLLKADQETAQMTSVTINTPIPIVPTTTAAPQEKTIVAERSEQVAKSHTEQLDITPEGIIGDDDQVLVSDTSQPPYRQIVRLNILHEDGDWYVGSGAMISPNLILTAAHNVYNQETGEWATYVEASPSRNSLDKAPYGSYEAENYVILEGYQKEGANQFDMAVIQLSQPVDARVGELSIAKDVTVGQRVQIAGYPYQSPQKLDDMYTMVGTIDTIDNKLLRYQIDTEGGQSGSPVLNEQGEIIGVHIAGFSNGSTYVYNGARRVDDDTDKLIQALQTGLKVGGVSSYKPLDPNLVTTTMFPTTEQTTTSSNTTRRTTSIEPTTKISTKPTTQTMTTPSTKVEVVYRLYHSGIKRHLYTKSSYEAQVLSDRGWRFEGEKFRTATKGIPVYRLYHSGTREQLYTTSANERDTLKTRGWRYEGIAWYSTGQTPIYRLYHAGLKVHLFTADINEKKTLSERGWTYEGISFYVK